MSNYRKNENKHQSVVNIGTASMVVILVGLSFAVLAALAIASARNDYKLSTEYAKHTKEYYSACNEAYIMVDEHKWKDEAFAVPINDDLQLDVIVLDGEINQWQVENVAIWQGDAGLPVFTIED